MKKMLLAVLLFGALSAPAFAADNWIDQFLSRYKPSSPSLPAERTAAQDPTPALIRNGAIPLSVPDLINLTLQNNLDISVNRLNPYASGYLIDTNYRPFEPTLTIGASVTRDRQPSRSLLSGPASALSTLTHTGSIAYSQTLQTGTDVSVEFSLSRQSTNTGFTNFNPLWAGSMRWTATQHLLKNRGRTINTRSISIAQNNKTISEVQFERQVIDMVTQAQKTYWDLVFTAEDLKVKQSSLDLAQKTLNDNKTQVEVGTLARIDLVQAEAEVANRNEQLIVTSYTQTQIEDQVKKLFSPQPDPGLILARIAPTQSVRQPATGDTLPVADAIRVALENRLELRQASLELRNNDIDLKYNKNQLLPSVDVNAVFNQSGVGGPQTLREGGGVFDPTAPVIGIVPGGFSNAFTQLFGYNFTGYILGVNVQVPLSNRAAKAEYARVATQKSISEKNIKALESQIALEVRNAITQLDMNKARIAAATQSRILAKEKLDAEQKKFELGASTVRFVLEEQRNFEEMQSGELSATVNYAKALVDYDRALGLTLKKNNVTIDKTQTAMK